MKLKIFLLAFLLIPQICLAKNYLKFSDSPYKFTPVYDDLYVNETGDTMTGKLVIDGGADEIQLRIQGNATQTFDIFVVEKLDGTDYFRIKDNGTVDIIHIAATNDDYSLEIDTDAAGFGDVKAIDLFYDTGNISAGEDEGVILINVDEIDSTGGDIFGVEILATDGLAGIYGLKAGALVGPIHQDSGTFANPTTGTDNTTDTDVPAMIDGSILTTTAIFENNNEYILIGAATAFEEIEFILTTGSSGAGIKPTFGYSTAGSHQFTPFSPVDGTNGFRNTGVVAWDASDLTGHTTNDDTGTYDIKITRTRVSLSTTPVLGYAKTAATTEYIWDKDGDVNIRNLDLTGKLDFTLSATETHAINIDGDTNDYTSSTAGFIIQSTRDVNVGTGNVNSFYGISYDLSVKNTDATMDRGLFYRGGSYALASLGNAITNTTGSDYPLWYQGAVLSVIDTGSTYDTDSTGKITVRNEGVTIDVSNASTWNDTGGNSPANILDLYGVKATVASGPTLNAGDLTVTNYGLYLDVSGDATGTSTVYGIYIADATGADTNYSVYDASGSLWDLGSSNFTTTGTGTINTNSTTALFVEQNGVKDNVLVVDTTNGGVGINVAPFSLRATGGTFAVNDTFVARGAVQIGANAPDSGFKSLIQIADTCTDTSGNILGLETLIDANPASTSSASYRGMKGFARTASGNAQDFTDNIALIGMHFEAIHQGSGNISDGATGAGIVGLQAAAGALSGAGNIDNVYGAYIYPFQTSSSTITNAYGGYFTLIRTAGTITNMYGVYVDTISGTGITNPWGIYQSDTGAPSYFAAPIYLTQTDGNEYIDSNADNYTDVGATTAVRINDILQLVGVTSDPTEEDGMIWYRSDTDEFRVRINGATKTLVVANP